MSYVVDEGVWQVDDLRLHQDPTLEGLHHGPLGRRPAAHLALVEAGVRIVDAQPAGVSYLDGFGTLHCTFGLTPT